MSLDVATAVLPYQRLADRPFALEWELASDDGTPDGAPEDVGDVTAARVTAQQQVQRGQTQPAAKVWDLSTGVSLPIVSVSGVNTPVLTVVEPTGLPAGTYDLIAAFDRTGGTDFVLRAVLELVVQP